MILKDIADATGLDVSTISRVVNSKYVQTQFGILRSNSCFSEAMQTDSGEEVSSYEIKNILSECIDKENKRKPLTDETLMDILNDKGYRIARRTVAKYREMLGFRSPGCAAVVGGRRTAPRRLRNSALRGTVPRYLCYLCFRKPGKSWNIPYGTV